MTRSRTAAALLLALALTGCSSAGDPEPSGSTPPPGAAQPTPTLSGTVDALEVGAAGDGTTDDAVALQGALDAMAPGSTLVLPEGRTFAVGDVLTVRAQGTTITGGGTLLATDEERSSLRLDHVDDAVLDGITLAIAGTTKRWDSTDQQRLHVDGGTGVVVRDVSVEGSAAAGVYVGDGASDFTLERVAVSGTRADGIHITQRAHDGVVRDATATRTGDDGIAVVSYAQDGDPCRDVLVERPVVRTTDARGISVVGGERITYRDVDVADTAAAAVYIASEGSYDTAGVTGVVVEGGVLDGANRDEGTDHGAVLLYESTGRGIDDVVVRDLDITGTRASASRQVGVLPGDEGRITGVTLDGLRLAGGPSTALVVGGDVPGLVTDGWTVDGAPLADPGS